MTTATGPLTFALQAQKRAVKAPEHGSRDRNGNLNDWIKDEADFLRRWPDNLRPEGDGAASTNAAALIEKATALNEAQLRSGFLDWLWVVDVAAPVHRHTSECPQGKEKA